MIFRRRSLPAPTEETVACDRIRRSDLFDAAWYLAQYPDVLAAGFDPVVHYVRHGAHEGRRPGPWFDSKSYLATLQDGAEVSNPLLHYLQNQGQTTLKVLREKRKYLDFAGFLRFSLLNPVIKAPFFEEDRRCFAVMEVIGKNLLRALNGEESKKVSIIMPMRNRAHTLSRAIHSVLAQRYKNFELIVIDDASDDSSVVIVEEFASIDTRIRLIRLAEHVGVSRARNLGLAHATGDLIAYLDSDNSWLPDYLGVSVGALARLTAADAIYSGQYIYESSDLEKLSAVRFAPMNISLLEQHNYIDLNCFVHRRAVICSGIRFDESLQRLVDWDFILNIEAQFRIFSVPVIMSQYYLQAAENTISKTVPIDSALARVSSRKFSKKYVTAETSLSRKLCVIIPSYQAMGFLQRCVSSLAAYFEDDMFEMVIVDNNSSEEVRCYLRSLARKNIHIVLNDVNYGFSYAVNQGSELASAEADIVVLNNDAWVEEQSLELLQQAAYEYADIAITVPRQILPRDSNDINVHVPYAAAGSGCDVSLSVHHDNIESIPVFHDGRKVELNFAPFFCVYIKRTVWNACRGLDYENGRHYRSDRTMCDFVTQVLKQRIVYTPDAKVHHAVQVSTRELIHGTDDGRDKYRDMLIKNIWPDDLMKDLQISKKPWHST